MKCTNCGIENDAGAKFCGACGQKLNSGVPVSPRGANKAEDAETCFQNGEKYYYGKGVEKDFVEAMKWYTKAAEQGLAKAQNALGFCYEEFQNYTEATKWYTKAAEQGLDYAQGNLAICYYNGKGVEKDYAEAAKWWTKAAEQGNAKAQSNLGVLYCKGKGVEKDCAEAVKWWTKAAEQGFVDAQKNLGSFYYNGEDIEKDFVEAKKWWTKAAEQGYAAAQYMLGQWYEFGWNPVEQSYTEAVKWYTKAAEQEHIDATEKVLKLNQQYFNIIVTELQAGGDSRSQERSCCNFLRERYGFESYKKMYEKFRKKAGKAGLETGMYIVNEKLPFSLDCCFPGNYAMAYAEYLKKEAGIIVELQPTEDVLPEVITVKIGNFIFGKKFDFVRLKGAFSGDFYMATCPMDWRDAENIKYKQCKYTAPIQYTFYTHPDREFLDIAMRHAGSAFPIPTQAFLYKDTGKEYLKYDSSKGKFVDYSQKRDDSIYWWPCFALKRKHDGCELFYLWVEQQVTDKVRKMEKQKEEKNKQIAQAQKDKVTKFYQELSDAAAVAKRKKMMGQ